MTVPVQTVYEQGLGQINADGLNSLIQGTYNVAQARAFTGLPWMIIAVEGTAVPLDGGAGFFVFDPNSDTADDNGVTTIKPVGAQGAWTRIVFGGGGSGGIQTVLDTGTANALIVALSPAITSYTLGVTFFVVPAHSTTGAATINVNGVGAKSITFNGSALPSGAMVAGQIYLLDYDGTEFQLISVPGAGWVTASALAAMPPYTILGNDTGSTAVPTAVPISALQSTQLPYVVDTGAANAYVVTLSSSPGSYVAGLVFSMKVGSGNTNTGASTVNVNGLGTKAIQYQGAALHTGQLVTGKIYILEYDGTEFQLISPSSTYKTGSTSITLPAANAAVGTVGSQGATWYPDGTIEQWCYIQIEDYGNTTYTDTTWTYPIAFPNGPLEPPVMSNMAVAAGQTGGFSARATPICNAYGTTTASFCLQNSANTGTLAVFGIIVKGN